MKKIAFQVVFIVFASTTSCTHTNNKNSEVTEKNQSDTSQGTADVSKSDKPAGDDFNLDKIAVSTEDLGDFPYFKLPDDYLFTDPDHQNGNGKGLTVDYDKEYFLHDGVYIPVEGRTFKGHISLNRNAKDKTFAPLELNKSFDDLITKMGGVKINNGKGYKTGEKDRIKELDPQAETNGYLNSSQYYDNIYTYVIKKPDYNVWIQYNLGGETGYITVLKTKEFENKMSILKSDQIQKDLNEKGKVILHINFDTDKATLKPDGKDAVAEITKALQADKNLKISINGYTDNSGNGAHNLQLSKDRAETVKKAIIASAVEVSRLTSDGFGSNAPIADNSSEEGKGQNRRVELVKK